MATSTLVLHCGGQEVTVEDLRAVRVPERTRTWAPVSHLRVLETALGSLKDCSYQVQRTRLALAKDGARFFATLDLTDPLVTGVTLAVGLRNSLDKTFPMGFCAGSRVFCCDNLCFRADLLIRRKHSPNGAARFADDIARAVMNLQS